MDDYIDRLEDTGTPEDIPDDARDGFELSIDLLKDVDFGADQGEVVEEMQGMEDDLSDDEQEQLDAFDEYQEETCADDLPTEDLPTE